MRAKQGIVVFDDFRLIGRYKTVKDAFYDKAPCKNLKALYTKARKNNGVFVKDNIYIFDTNNISAVCTYKGLMLAKIAKNSPDVRNTERILDVALKELLNTDCLF